MPEGSTVQESHSFHNTQVPTWEVNLLISGPVKARTQIHLLEPKNAPRSDLYYSDVLVRDAPQGVKATVEARAQSAQLARRAALVFIGQMLDVLAFRIDLSLYVSLVERYAIPPEGHPERRIVEEVEWHSAFEESRVLSFAEPTFLRALGWYRKGLYTEDPFDRYLAFWNSIEVVAGKYHVKNEKTDLGSKNQIWDCFERLWGPCGQWPTMADQSSWIADHYKMRKDIAHGVAAVTAREVEAVLCEIEPVKEVAHRFLAGWREEQLHPNIPAELLEKFGRFG